MSGFPPGFHNAGAALMPPIRTSSMNNVFRALLVIAGVMLSGSVWAQGNPIKITTCGTASPPAGASNPYMDATGLLCTSATGGGGGSVTQGTSPWVDNITQWASGVLGAMANYGTSPGAVLVPGVNAFVTSSALPTGAATAANQGTPYPPGATAITASATGTTAATTATLAGTSGKTTYICSLSIRANATAAATANSTVTGTITGTLNYTQWTAPNASGIGLTEQVFVPCVPASATNTGIAVISAAPGTGGVVSVTATGFQL